MHRFWALARTRVHAVWPSFFLSHLRVLSLYLDDRGRKKGHQPYKPYRMMASARIGTSACEPQLSLLKKPTEWIQCTMTFQIFILSVVFIFGFNSFSWIYHVFIPSAPFGTSKNPFSRSALQEAKSAQISERIALLALADADHLQKSFCSAGE